MLQSLGVEAYQAQVNKVFSLCGLLAPRGFTRAVVKRRGQGTVSSSRTWEGEGGSLWASVAMLQESALSACACRPQDEHRRML